MLIMVDTNVLARYADQQSSQHAEAVEALRLLQAAGHSLVFNPQIKREFLDIAERPQCACPGTNGLGLTNEQARAWVVLFLSLHGYVGEVSSSDEHFDKLHAKYGGGKTVHDLNIVASMLAHGVPSLLTFNDKHFNHLQAEGIEVKTPEMGTSSKNTNDAALHPQLKTSKSFKLKLVPFSNVPFVSQTRWIM